MAELWMPGAQKLAIGNTAPMDGGPAKAVAHVTWDKNATSVKPQALVPYENLRSYFSANAAGKAVAPHLLWDPFTGRIVQFFPANSRSLSLADAPGGTRTNRAGKVVIQVEALFFPYCKVDGKVYAKLADTPCKGWAELQSWVQSWGVPNAWPNGRPESCTRNTTTWASTSGWYPHKAVPENDHTDPGSWPAFVGATAPPATSYTPPAFPTGLRPNSASPSARGLQKVMKALGHLSTSVAYADNYGPATQQAVAAFHNAHPLYRAEGVSRDVAIGPKGWKFAHTKAYGGK
ncbi:peptidoglycan-binding protein [Streptomyces sp. NPDC057620]|uniref:peptidoglycan-binding domain-containing protein n=1 Tax=Streptomyces sp. NPDC057620 TaxID=3346185 RepID=UPI003677AFE7